MLSSETKVVTYVNKKGERSTYQLNSAMESTNVEMVKRLKYTKDILTHMLNANPGSTMPDSAAQSQRPKTNAEISSRTGAKASGGTERANKQYQTSQGFNPKDVDQS